MMKDDIIEFFKKIRKTNYLKNKYNKEYAFVGIGNHSINNLYPILNYLNVPLKYIVCKSKETADLVNRNFSPIIGTTDYGEVLSDPNINGIFICANPSAHYKLTKEALLRQKNVFIEKPPCLSLSELEDLANITQGSTPVCLAGMQKRYSKCTSLLKKKLDLEKVISYSYRFLVGAYPEGNVYWDMFIHPIDLIIYLFGEMEIVSTLKTEQNKGSISIFLQVRHKEIIGNIEISTCYTWSDAKEELQTNTRKGLFEMLNHQLLTYVPKPDTILSIPVEKIFPPIPKKQYLFNGNNFLPVFQNNQLVAQGYYDEIHTFLDLCEKGKAKNISSPQMLINTYKMIELLK